MSGNLKQMKYKNLTKLFFLIPFFLAFNIQAQENQNVIIEVKSMVDTSVITIGDQIQYSIIIDREKDLKIIRPGEGLNLGAFGIKDYTFHEPVGEDGRISERFDFTRTVFDTGQYTIPPFPIAYFLNDSSSQYRIIKAAAIEIYVKSVLSGDSAKELKDIKLPLWIDFDYLFWGIVIVLIILVLLLSWYGWKFYKRRKEQGYLFVPPKPPRPAHEIALEALRELYAADMLEQRQYKQFFSRLSEIIRIYIEGRYAIKALEETTYEILYNTKGVVEQAEQKENLTKLLNLSDLVKFAKHLPKIEECDETKDQALDFVEETKEIVVVDLEEVEEVVEVGSEK